MEKENRMKREKERKEESSERKLCQVHVYTVCTYKVYIHVYVEKSVRWVD